MMNPGGATNWPASKPLCATTSAQLLRFEVEFTQHPINLQKLSVYHQQLISLPASLFTQMGVLLFAGFFILMTG